MLSRDWSFSCCLKFFLFRCCLVGSAFCCICPLDSNFDLNNKLNQLISYCIWIMLLDMFYITILDMFYVKAEAYILFCFATWYDIIIICLVNSCPLNLFGLLSLSLDALFTLTPSFIWVTLTAQELLNYNWLIAC